MDRQKLSRCNNSDIILVMLGLIGLAYGLTDWSGVFVDIVYKQFNNKTFIVCITTGITVAKIIGTLFTMTFSNAKSPKKIMELCTIFCVGLSILTSISILIKNEYVFMVVYVLSYVATEAMSMYYYNFTRFASNTNVATIHANRVGLFKVAFTAGIFLTGHIYLRYKFNGLIFACLLSAFVFSLQIMLVSRIKNISYIKDEQKLIKKLDIRQYTTFFKVHFMSKAVEAFGLANIIVLISLIASDMSINIKTIENVKSIMWVVISVGFVIAGYFAKNDFDFSILIISKTVLAFEIIGFIMLHDVYLLLLIIITYGLVTSIAYVASLSIINKDKEKEKNANQKSLIDLSGQVVQVLANVILLSINTTAALIIIAIFLILSVIIQVYNNTLSYKEVRLNEYT